MEDEPKGSVPRYSLNSYIYMISDPKRVFFYVHFKEVTAYPEAEEIQADKVHGKRLLL